MEINLGDRTDMGLNRSSTSYEPQMRYETCQYIPVIETLKSMLEKPEMQSIVNNENSSNDGFLSSFMDRKFYKNDDVFTKYPNILRIQLY